VSAALPAKVVPTPRRSEHGSIQQMLAASELGGAELVALRLARYLDDEHRPSGLWTPRRERSAHELATAATYDAAALLGARLLPAAQQQLAIARRLRRERCAIAHVHAPFLYGALRWCFRIAGCKAIVHIHSHWEEAGLRWALRRPPDAIITCARYLEDEVRACLPASQRDRTPIVTIPNAVDTDLFQPGDKTLAKRLVGARLDRPLVLMLANLAPLKGQATAIEAVALLKQRGIAVDCWLAGVERGGATTYTSELQTKISSAGVADRVQLLGQRHDTADLLRAADVLWLPSQSEGLPLSILEAQATQTPVIAAPVGGIPDVIADGVTGFLVAPSDAEGYALRTSQLLDSPALVQQLTAAAYQQILREHRWPVFAERVMAIYERVLAG
jgi:glycosyltransferase involved in cell wall biosynthesis